MADPFKIDGPTCISFSGGRTSAYMLWRVLQANGGLPKEAKVCFANTGKEDEATLRFVKDCQDIWGVDVAWLEYEPSGYRQVSFETASRHGEPFEALIKKKKYLPNPVARFCTEELKVKTIDRYFKSLGIEPETMVGVRADEQRRVAKLRARGLLIPLVDSGVTQHDVQSFWRAQPFDLGLVFRDGVTPLGNCDLCFLKGPQQVMGIIKDSPERAIWWARMEREVGATFRSDRASYGEMHQFLTDQADMFSTEGGISCFCGD